jgi:hypothetical protein
VKSLGAKTNHLPNIQGLIVYPPLQEGVGTKKLGWNSAPARLVRIENQFISSGTAESRLSQAVSGG